MDYPVVGANRTKYLSDQARLLKPHRLATQMSQDLHQLTIRHFLARLIPLTLIGAAAFYYAFSLLERVEKAELDSMTTSAVELARGHASQHFETVQGDLKFIADSDQVRQFFQDRNQSGHRKKIEREFVNMARTHKIYDQIRLLSETGTELIRVNYASGNPVMVPLEQLQDKSDRYYFNGAASLFGNQVYISPIDLNKEKGRIERPYKPVIRFAQAVRDPSGDLIGVIVLNYLGEKLLTGFRQNMNALPGKSMLLNGDGYWLSSDNSEQEWGFMFDQPVTFATKYPDIWHQVQTQDAGIVETDEGRFTFSTVHPLPQELLADMQPSRFLDDWKIIVINKQLGLNTEYLAKHFSYIFPLLVAYPISLIMLWFWARASSGRTIAKHELRALNSSLEDQVLSRTAELQATKDVTILSMATLAETRDNETGQHIRRTQHYIKLLASTLKDHPDFHQLLDEASIEVIFKSAPLHDIGKVGIPDAILLKPAKLTDDEFEVMKKHTVYGSDAIEEAINSLSTSLAIDGSGTFLHYARDIAHCHHERWDGSGYPKGLAGDSIPLAARLMALADVYDALVSQRVYKKAFSREQAEEIILRQSQGQFDPRILKAFEQVKDQFWQIRIRYAESGEHSDALENRTSVDPTAAA